MRREKHTNIDRPGGGNSINGFQESRRIRTQDTNSLVTVLLDVECKTARPVRRLHIRPAQYLLVGGNVIDSLRLVSLAIHTFLFPISFCGEKEKEIPPVLQPPHEARKTSAKECES